MTNPFRVLASLAMWAALATLVAACGGGPGGPEGSSSGNQPADTTPPAVVSKLPTNDQEDVDRASAIVVTFSEALNPSTVTSVNVLLRRAGVSDVQREIRWEAASRTVYIKPKTLLALDTQYKVTLTRGLKDAAGNELPQQEEWLFTTGPTIDYDPPVWRCSAVVTAEPLRFDTVEVSWGGQSLAQCPAGTDEVTTPATDNVTPPEWLTYIVSYKLVSETGFSTATSLPGASSLKVAGLQPKQAYEFKVQVRDLAEYLSEPRSLDGSILLPPAGRLYAANFLANAVSSIPDIGTVNGDQAGTQVFSANETGLSTPIGVAVSAGGVTLKCDLAPCDPPAGPASSMLYVSSFSANSITAYENPETLGEYPNRINAAPAWTLRGVETSLAEPAALWVDTETDANNVIVRETLYVANMRGMSRTLFGEQPVGNILAFNVTRTVSNRTGAPQDPNGNSPPFGKIKSAEFRTPMSFAVDKAGHRLYVVNRDKEYNSSGTGDQQGNVILAFRIPDPGGLDSLMNDSVPAPYFIQGSCLVPECALLGPTSIALDKDNDRLYVANRGQNNLVVIENVSQADAALYTTRVIEGELAELLIKHPTSPTLPEYKASPNAVWFDPVTRRLFATTRNAQSVLIFDVSNTVMNTTVAEGPLTDFKPIRVIRGSRTGLGQPSGSAQSAGPFGLTVVNGEAYVASYGLHAIPIFDVSPNMDGFDTSTNTWNTPPNTPPIRLLMTPMQGLTGAALDPGNDRLYVAVFHSNLILVYDNASTLTGSHLLPDRIIGGPATMLDHPVHLVFSPARADRTAALFVANQSGHSVSVFGGETARDVGILSGSVAPSRMIGPPDDTDPFSLAPLASQCVDPTAVPAGVNCTELAFPTGIALDEASNVLYVSNRDATAFEDSAGRKILAFTNVFGVDGNVRPTWKIEGDPPPPPSYNMVLPPTDKTTLQRPAALYYDPNPNLDHLYVANRGRKSILVFTGVSSIVTTSPTTDYNVAPTWTITNANLFAPTGFTGYIPSGSSALSELYVADAGTNAILAFRVGALDATDSTPTLTPRIIRGASLGLNQPFGLALDPDK
jgi:DNA-binding beta-propeller fold protein YncE